MKNPTKDLFDFMKAHGFYSEYADYDDYQKRKFGIGQEHTESFREFWESLSEKDKEDFNSIFENEQ